MGGDEKSPNLSMLILHSVFFVSSSDYGTEYGSSVREHPLSHGLSDDAQSDQADCGGWHVDAASDACPAIRQCPSARVNGGAFLRAAHVAHQCSPDKRVDAEWTAGGFSAVLGPTRGTALVDCRLVVVP